LLPNPPAAGFWQPAQGPPADMGCAFADIAPRAYVENCFSTEWLWQTGVTPSRIKTSDRFPRYVQLHSYRGMRRYDWSGLRAPAARELT
jgi:hypothetical protein